MKRTQRHALNLVAFALAGALALLRGEATGPVAPAASGAAAEVLRPVERAFIVEGVESARQEAEVCRLAMSQASSSVVRELAQQLVADYSGITALLETLARRKAVELPLQPTSFSDRYRELSLHTGAAFDIAFIREIAAANQRTLRLCESAVANAKDTDVREIAGGLLPVIRDHVNKSTTLAGEL